MARVAVIDPDDDPLPPLPFALPAVERDALVAALTGARLEVREDHGLLLARITADRALDRALRWFRRRLGPPA
jgi:hypothetical protein